MMFDDDSAIDAAGTIFANWAHRETVMRQQARSPEPLHVQYAGGGNIIAQPDGSEVVFLAPLPADQSISIEVRVAVLGLEVRAGPVI